MLHYPTTVGAVGCHTTHTVDGADIQNVPLSACRPIPVSYTKTMMAFNAQSLRPYIIRDTSFWQLCTFDNRYKSRNVYYPPTIFIIVIALEKSNPG